MFLGLPGFAWFVIGVIVVAVHHVKHVWLEEPTDAIDIKESEYPKPIKREISDEEYENWEKWMDYLEDRRKDA